MEVEEFRVRGKEMIDYICAYLATMESKRVTPNVEPGYLRDLLPEEAPEEPEEWDKIMDDVDAKIMPGVTHWQHPRFHAYFPSGNSFPSILGDMLSDAIGCIGFSWAASPACTELETIVMDWFGKAIGLPDEFITTSGPKSSGGGVIQSSASECVLVSMLAARNQAINHLKRSNPHVDDIAFLPKLVAYCSRESHSCVEKAAMILLVKLRILEPDENCSLRGETLRKAMEEDEAGGLVPFFVSTTLGSTACCAFDNLQEIGPICSERPCTWLHVDGAYAGNAFICPELKPLMAGIEFADSFNTNPNKWLLVNFDCSCLWVRCRMRLTSALVVDPLYLQHANSDEAIDYRHWGIPLSRRFRSLKLWFVMRKYGISGLQKYIRNHIGLAKQFEGLVRRDRRFEVVNDVKLGLVCFRLIGPDTINQTLLAAINASGKLHMIPSIVKGKYILRFCVVNEHACQADIDEAWGVIRAHASQLQKPLSPEIVVSRPPLTRSKSRRFSFTRSVSREIYRRSMSKNNLYDGATPILIPDDDNTTNRMLEHITSRSYPEVHCKEENLIRFARFERPANLNLKPTNHLIRHVLQREHSLDEIRMNGYAKVITNKERQARISHSEQEEDEMNEVKECKPKCLTKEPTFDDDVFVNVDEAVHEKRCPQANVFTQEFNDFIIKGVTVNVRNRHPNEL